MLVNPRLERTATCDDGRVFAVEVCDPVDEDRLEIDGVALANFVYPSWFGGGPPYDQRGRLARPFELGTRGYAHGRIDGAWHRVLGSRGKRAEHRADEHGSRGRRRTV